ncbi:biotin--[acetyl-CoA-carboxylase] ligase [Novipirellula sp. SH528]|uniref:biotin--[acetyl-CoA-carboxylase] ligase n=1 Tax=Novipirellula sp. SH528 TaxID=3454466 RepID=UPI003FA14AAC
MANRCHPVDLGFDEFVGARMIQADEDVDPSGIRVVQSLLDDHICASAVYHHSTASTNSDALSELTQGNVTQNHLPRLYIADRQTAGRGRQGNTWLSSDDALTFSLTVAFDLLAADRRGLLSLAAGLATARAIEFLFAPVRAYLKWPNDVYLAGGKVAGVLIETNQATPDRVVIGIGVNINEQPKIDTPGAASPQSLFSATGRIATRFELLDPIVRELVEIVASIKDSPKEVLAEFRSRCYLTNKVIAFRDRGVDNEGTVEGIADDGSLLVQTHEGLRRCDSGEVRLVRLR